MTENEVRNGLKKISEMLESQEWAKHINEIPESHIQTRKGDKNEQDADKHGKPDK